jgi:predicted nuclease with RNAse H fold
MGRTSRVPVVVGVDVGGKEKGFHAAAFLGGRLTEKLATCDVKEIVDWCRSRNASAVGIDAPCKWSLDGGARPCECELARLGITAFATPCITEGRRHPFYRWMLNGAELFHALAPHYRLYDVRQPFLRPVCFETFAHAVACTLAGRRLSAKQKRTDRRRLLTEAGITTDRLSNLDEIDAALCALTAHHFLAGRFKAYGDAAQGFIIVPSR